MSLLLLGCVLSCGGGTMTQNENQTQNTIGPTAILNGPNLLGVGSSWVSSACGVDVELTSDNAFGFIIGTTSGSKFAGTGTWMPVSTTGASFTTTSGVLQGFALLDSLGNISGSTSSKKFTADTIVDNSLGELQDLGTCSFSLQVGPLNLSNP